MNLFGFLQPKTVFETSTPYNEKIEIVKILGTTKLRTYGGTQSVTYNSILSKSGYWKLAAEIIASKAPRAQNILFLGFGGGTAVYFVSKALPQARLVCVEIDAVVIDLAKQYFQIDKINNIQLVNADGFKFIEGPEKYDVIFADMFKGDYFVEIPNIDKFLNDLKNSTNLNGLVLFNYTFKKNDSVNLNAFIEKIKGIFGNAEFSLVSGAGEINNYLIYSFKN